MFHVVSGVVWMRKIRRPAELIGAEVFDCFCPPRFVRIATHKALLSERLLRSSGLLDAALTNLGIEDRFHLIEQGGDPTRASFKEADAQSREALEQPVLKHIHESDFHCHSATQDGHKKLSTRHAGS